MSLYWQLNNFYRKGFQLKIKLASIIFITITFFGCSKATLLYDQEAKVFCDLHDVENWEGGARRASNAELKSILDQKVSEVKFSNEFQKIINDLDEIKFVKKLYPSAQEKIQAFTGELWECPAYKEFYSVKFERITPKIEPKQSSLIINISASGDVVVNDSLVRNTTGIEFNKVISSLELQSPVSATITVDKGAPEEILNQIMEALKNTDVEKLAVIKK